MIVHSSLPNISSKRENPCQSTYTQSATSIVNMFDINDEKKSTRASKISNLKNVKSKEKAIRSVIAMPFISNTQRKRID